MTKSCEKKYLFSVETSSKTLSQKIFPHLNMTIDVIALAYKSVYSRELCLLQCTNSPTQCSVRCTVDTACRRYNECSQSLSTHDTIDHALASQLVRVALFGDSIPVVSSRRVRLTYANPALGSGSGRLCHSDPETLRVAPLRQLIGTLTVYRAFRCQCRFTWRINGEPPDVLGALVTCK